MPSNVSNRWSSRSTSWRAIRVRATACMLPPRQTPHSTTAPGTRWWTTYRVASMSAAIFSVEVIVWGRTRSTVSYSSSSNRARNRACWRDSRRCRAASAAAVRSARSAASRASRTALSRDCFSRRRAARSFRSRISRWCCSVSRASACAVALRAARSSAARRCSSVSRVSRCLVTRKTAEFAACFHDMPDIQTHGGPGRRTGAERAVSGGWRSCRTRSMAMAGTDRTMDFRLLLSVTKEKSRRRLKMIVSGAITCRQPASRSRS